jgi:quinol-cytochrome oxidoreductase complex cytochrome b subunit
MTHEPGSQDEDLKTFDMYHFFSRKDVIALALFLVLLVLFVLYKVFFAPVVA